jgi:hypothetical protein
MKITENRLKQIIDEEVVKMLKELGFCHNNKGFFDSCKKGNTYSLSDKGADRAGVDNKYVKRGILTKDKEEDESPKLRTPFGLNTSKDKQGGRIKMKGGDKKSPYRSVSQYPAPYPLSEEDINLAGGLSLKQIEAIIKGALSDSNIEEGDNAKLKSKCHSIGMMSSQDAIKRVLRGVNLAVLASKGDLQKD